MKLIFQAVSWGIRTAFGVCCSLLPAAMVFLVLSQPALLLNRGVPVVQSKDFAEIHELFPNSTWDDLEPCGKHFNELQEFHTALQCVNKKVWSDTPLNAKELIPPRCFVLKAQSPNVFTDKDLGFNFIPMFSFNRVGAVVGVYQPETKTLFIVENIDAAMIYRHELQHYFLHLHDPETEGGGHHQNIWKMCEPPHYTPSVKTRVSSKLSN